MRIISFFALVFLVSACDICGSRDCDIDDFYGEFRFVDKTSGKDLVFGSQPVYDRSLMQFYSLLNGDTTFYKFESIAWGGTGFDSILYVDFFPATAQPVYMKLSATDVDTVNFVFDTNRSRCCGQKTDISTFVINGGLELRGTGEPQTIPK